VGVGLTYWLVLLPDQRNATPPGRGVGVGRAYLLMLLPRRALKNSEEGSITSTSDLPEKLAR
jgi:hypothetical protein